MIHLTLNTGHVAVQPDTGPPGIAEMMLPLLSGGSLAKVAPELSAYRVEIVREPGCAVYSVFRGETPIVTCMLCWAAAQAEAAWAALESQYLAASDQFAGFMGAAALPERPATLPWLAVLLQPTIVLQPAEAFDWLGDFERCVAWAILAQEGQP